jgi:hypothetical protein
MNCATQQTARSHPEREPSPGPSGVSPLSTGPAGASTLTGARAAVAVACAPNADDTLRVAALPHAAGRLNAGCQGIVGCSQTPVQPGIGASGGC